MVSRRFATLQNTSLVMRLTKRLRVTNLEKITSRLMAVLHGHSGVETPAGVGQRTLLSVKTRRHLQLMVML